MYTKIRIANEGWRKPFTGRRVVSTFHMTVDCHLVLEWKLEVVKKIYLYR